MADTIMQTPKPSIKQSAPAQGESLLVVDLGKRQGRKSIKQLRQGRGKLLEKVTDLLAEMREKGAIDSNAQPVVIVVREKERGLTGLGF